MLQAKKCIQQKLLNKQYFNVINILIKFRKFSKQKLIENHEKIVSKELFNVFVFCDNCENVCDIKFNKIIFICEINQAVYQWKSICMILDDQLMLSEFKFSGMLKQKNKQNKIDFSLENIKFCIWKYV